MSQTILRSAAAFCLASAVTFSATAAMADTPNPTANAIMKDTTQSRALKEYWSEERIKSATPVDMPTLASPEGLKKVKKRSFPGSDSGAAPVKQMLIEN